MNDSLLNLSCVGKSGKMDADGIIIPPKKIEIFARFNRFGRGFVGVKYEATNNHNLKRGERKQLNRSNLTPHARRMIQGVGDFFEFRVYYENAPSSIMLTLTYARNVPDHATAKKHLKNLIRNLKQYGHFKYYAWVAQLQTGERAIQKGKDSYRVKHGAAIHFHILTEQIPAKLVRDHWVRIVNKWEMANGWQPSKMSGVNIVTVYNASNYISRYISNESKSGNIIGSLWGVSSNARSAIDIRDTVETIKTTDFDWSDFVKLWKLKNPNYVVRETTYLHQIHSCKDWMGLPLVFSRDVSVILKEYVKFLRNKINAENRYNKTVSENLFNEQYYNIEKWTTK